MFESSGTTKVVDTWKRKISKKFESKKEYLIPILQFVQSKDGYLPPEAMEATARYLRIPKSKVFGVASFYAQFNFEPQGRHKITICRGTACHVRGSGRLLQEIEGYLGIKAGETKEDLSFTLETVACFGACALAPVVVVDDKVERQQTPASLKRIVKSLESERGLSSKTSKSSKQSRRGKKRKGSLNKKAATSKN